MAPGVRCVSPEPATATAAQPNTSSAAEVEAMPLKMRMKMLRDAAEAAAAEQAAEGGSGAAAGHVPSPPKHKAPPPGKSKNKRDRATMEATDWIQCDRCQKWRRLAAGVVAALPEDALWTCSMHPDGAWSSCDVPEEAPDDDEEDYDAFVAREVAAALEPLLESAVRKAARELELAAKQEAREREHAAKRGRTAVTPAHHVAPELLRCGCQVCNRPDEGADDVSPCGGGFQSDDLGLVMVHRARYKARGGQGVTQRSWDRGRRAHRRQRPPA